jgi:hypothetical protein
MYRRLRKRFKRLKVRVQRRIKRSRLVYRWLRSTTRTEDGLTPRSAYGLDRCDVVYINLDHRQDRRIKIEEEVALLGLTEVQRIPGALADLPNIGCSRSHLNALNSWAPGENRLLLILEDDCQFLASREELDAVVEEFAVNARLEVLCIANNTRWSRPISDALAISAEIRTAAAYVVKVGSLCDLRAAMEDSIERLRAGEPPKRAANDVVWMEVQERRFFAVPRTRMAIQRPGYSDIQQHHTDYGV